MKTPTASSATSSQREQTSLLSQMPRSPRSNVCSTPDPENRSASVHRKRFSTPSLTLKFLCAGKLNPRNNKGKPFLRDFDVCCDGVQQQVRFESFFAANGRTENEAVQLDQFVRKHIAGSDLALAHHI